MKYVLKIYNWIVHAAEYRFCSWISSLPIVLSSSQVKNGLKWTRTCTFGRLIADGKPQYMAKKSDENSATEDLRTLFVEPADSNSMRIWMIPEIRIRYNESEHAASSHN